jgi:hypothetical protein
MKNLVLILSILISASAIANDHPNVFLNAVPAMSCFRYEFPIPKQHAWEKPRATIIGAYWVLLAKDKTAFLVAQPIPTCEDNKTVVAGVCPFWIRTVNREDSFLTLGSNNLHVVPCPKQLDKAFFHKLIQDKYSDELEF